MYIKFGIDKDLKIIVFKDGSHGNLVDGGVVKVATLFFFL